MTKNNNYILAVVLLSSVLALSACATKPKEAVVIEPAPITKVAEKETPPEPAPAVAAQTAAVPVVMAEQPARKPVVKKAKKKAAKAQIVTKVAEPKPVAAPAPVVQQAAPAAAPIEPTPPAVIAEPINKVAEPGFLEKYWLWLLGVVIAVIVVVWMKSRKS